MLILIINRLKFLILIKNERAGRAGKH